MKKYIKGKDGKFKGSLPSPKSVPKGSISQGLPPLPDSAEKPLGTSSAEDKALKAAREKLSKSLEIEYGQFYVSDDGSSYRIPMEAIEKIERGDYMYFHEDSMLFQDSYGENIAAYYIFAGANEEVKIDFSSSSYEDLRQEVASANSFAELSDKTKDIFKFGGCAALAQAIHKQLPGSTLTTIVGVPFDKPSDSTAAHVFVSKGEKIFDADGISEYSSYDFAAASDLDEENFEIMIYETDTYSINNMINHGVFGHRFTESSNPIIDKIACLIVKDNYL